MRQDTGERKFSELVGSIYEAAVEPAGWAAVVAEMKRYLNCPTGLIFLEDVHNRKARFTVTDGLDDGLVDQYYRHYIFLDPNLAAKNKLPVGTVTASNQVMRDNQWENSEYYHDFARHVGIFYQMGAYTHRSPDAFGGIGVHRPKDSNPFSKAEICSMRRIVPHMRQAFRVSSLLQGAQGTLSALIEFHPYGVFLIDAGGRIVLTNRRGEGLLRQRDGLILADGRLSAQSESGKVALGTAIRNAMLTGLGKGVHPGHALTLERPSGGKPYQVLVTPLHHLPAELDMGPHRICAAVLVNDPLSTPRASADVLREWFGLTAAEARVALSIAEGLSVKEIAERAGTTFETVRNQLKTVFSKVGVHRQAELVRLLLMSPAGHAESQTESEQDDGALLTRGSRTG